VSVAVQEIWDYTVGELAAMKAANSADRDALLCYCEAVAAHRRASALLAKTDVLIRAYNGAPRANPALSVQQRSAALIKAFAQEFGLTPAARTRVEVRGMDDGVDNIFAGIG
jgi:P27 family predicted phage terminase small subunit